MRRHGKTGYMYLPPPPQTFTLVVLALQRSRTAGVPPPFPRTQSPSKRARDVALRKTPLRVGAGGKKTACKKAALGGGVFVTKYGEFFDSLALGVFRLSVRTNPFLVYQASSCEPWVASGSTRR